MKESSPLLGMPIRNTAFRTEFAIPDLNEPLTPEHMFVHSLNDTSGTIGGRYSKDSSWKFWGNDGTEEENGKKISDYDQECTLRNMQISVVATSDS